ncbi:unnamed protein product [Rotaria socialis]
MQNFILNSTQPFPKPTQLKQQIRAGITSTRFSEKAVFPGKVPDFDRQPPLKITPFDSAQNSASNTTKMKFNTTIQAKPGWKNSNLVLTSPTFIPMKSYR